jgi:hypothetical protein
LNIFFDLPWHYHPFPPSGLQPEKPRRSLQVQLEKAVPVIALFELEATLFLVIIFGLIYF